MTVKKKEETEMTLSRVSDREKKKDLSLKTT